MGDEREQRYVVIGLGGVGGLLLRLLVPYLHHLEQQGKGSSRVLAVDGDIYEERNRSRQLFDQLGPKANVLAGELSEIYGDRVDIVPMPVYVTPQRARTLIVEGDVVFCCPDNHATRRMVERRCSRLRDVTLFSGGNDGIEDGRTGTVGNVQAYVRRAGRDETNPISAFHPEIARPADLPPTAQGCGAIMNTAPQLLFTNAAVAAAMLGTFYAWSLGTLGYEEAYLDVLTGSHVPVKRALRKSGGRAALIGQRPGSKPAAAT